VPAQIAPFLVERLGYSEARRLAVTGGKLDAAQALERRPCPRRARPGELDAALEAELAQIRKGAPNAIAATKALMRRARLEAPASLVRTRLRRSPRRRGLMKALKA
jgi:isohexenylglutaconyl-CoA hydratase